MAKDSTNQILWADQLACFKLRPNEDLEVYSQQSASSSVQLAGVDTPLSEASFCVYLVKGLTSDWEYLKQHFALPANPHREDGGPCVNHRSAERKRKQNPSGE